MFSRNIILKQKENKSNYKENLDNLSREVFSTEWKESYYHIINNLDFDKLFTVIHKYNIEKMKISPISQNIKIIYKFIKYKISSKKIEKELRVIFKGLPLKEKYYKNINWSFYYKIKKIKRLAEK